MAESPYGTLCLELSYLDYIKKNSTKVHSVKEDDDPGVELIKILMSILKNVREFMMSLSSDRKYVPIRETLSNKNNFI